MTFLRLFASSSTLTKKKKGDQEMNELIGFFKEEDGVTAIEYGLIAALIAVAIIVTVGLVGQSLSSIFNYIAGKLHV